MADRRPGPETPARGRGPARRQGRSPGGLRSSGQHAGVLIELREEPPGPHVPGRTCPNLAAPQQSNRSKSAALALDPHFNLQPASPDPLGEGHLKAPRGAPDDDGPTFL